MSYKVESFRSFDKQLRRPARKFPSLISGVRKINYQLRSYLEATPEMGIALGRSCYKIRLAIASKGGGKSGVARVITYVQVVGETVYLLSIYDKGEQSSIGDKEVLRLLKQLDD